MSGMQTQKAKQCRDNAISCQQNTAKITRISDDAELAEAKECKKEMLAFRAMCVSRDFKAAVKVIDRTVAMVNKMIAKYEAAQS